MMRLLAILLPICLIIVSACSETKPANQASPLAATIKGGSPVAEISRTTMLKRLELFRLGDAPPGTKGSRKDCQLNLQKQGIDPQEVKSRCLMRESDLLQQTSTLTIQQAWIANEAKEKRTRLTKREQKIVAEQPPSSQQSVLSNYLFMRLSRTVPAITPGKKDLRDAYRSRQMPKSRPPERKVVLLVADNQPVIEEAEDMLNSGSSPEQIVKSLDFDNETEASGGIRVVGPPGGVSRDPARPPTPLESFVLSLPVDKPTGPQLVQGRYVLARVLASKKARPLTKSEKENFARKLAIQNYRGGVLSVRLRNKWRPRTVCFGVWRISPLCRNFNQSPGGATDSP